MSERLTVGEEGKRKVFHGTMITNARELVGLLRRLNVTNDPKLEEARRDLEHALTNTDTETIKESDYVRETVKQKVDAIINKYNW
jgi:predicted secreted Zn-dependent protease